MEFIKINCSRSIYEFIKKWLVFKGISQITELLLERTLEIVEFSCSQWWIFMTIIVGILEKHVWASCPGIVVQWISGGLQVSLFFKTTG